MNSYRLNGMAGHFLRQAICKHLKIKHTEIYKVVKNMYGDTIELHDGRKFKVLLGEIVK